jgi:hypothetical protein
MHMLTDELCTLATRYSIEQVLCDCHIGEPGIVDLSVTGCDKCRGTRQAARLAYLQGISAITAVLHREPTLLPGFVHEACAKAI